MNFHFTTANAREQLNSHLQTLSVQLLSHGTMRLKYYAPQINDLQTPHKQDELYIIASGNGTFFRNGERVHFKQNDVLFAPAGTEHRFENFTNDFATWVVFYGAEGGEKFIED
jgi:mannose-6-phosphate isomerase-like protein (cupin superfamily)